MNHVVSERFPSASIVLTTTVDPLTTAELIRTNVNASFDVQQSAVSTFWFRVPLPRFCGSMRPVVRGSITPSVAGSNVRISVRGEWPWRLLHDGLAVATLVGTFFSCAWREILLVPFLTLTLLLISVTLMWSAANRAIRHLSGILADD